MKNICSFFLYICAIVELIVPNSSVFFVARILVIVCTFLYGFLSPGVFCNNCYLQEIPANKHEIGPKSLSKLMSIVKIGNCSLNVKAKVKIICSNFTLFRLGI